MWDVSHQGLIIPKMTFPNQLRPSPVPMILMTPGRLSFSCEHPRRLFCSWRPLNANGLLKAVTFRCCMHLHDWNNPNRCKTFPSDLSDGTKTTFFNFSGLFVLFFLSFSAFKKAPRKSRWTHWVDVEVKPSDTIEEVKVPWSWMIVHIDGVIINPYLKIGMTKKRIYVDNSNFMDLWLWHDMTLIRLDWWIARMTINIIYHLIWPTYGCESS